MDRNVKVTCEICGVQITKPNLARHKKSCSAGTLYCTQCLNFSNNSRGDIKYYIVKQHSTPRPSIMYKCKICHVEFPGYYALRQHKNSQHGTKIGFGANNITVEDIVGDIDDRSLREELESCQHFLTDTEMELGHTEFSTLPCHHSTCLCSTINWIMYSRN